MEKEKSAWLAIKLSVQLGQKLQDPAYNLSQAYVEGLSQTALADNLKKLPEFAEYARDTLAHAIRYKFVGNNDDRLGPVYEGDMAKEVYDEHSKRHRIDSGKSRGKISLSAKMGVHGLSKDKLRDCALRGAVARGETPWSRKELSCILEYSLLELFKAKGNVAYGPIAEEINNRFYKGKNVRNNVSVREALRRLQRSFAE